MQGKLIAGALAVGVAAAGASVAFGSSPSSGPARTIKATLFYTNLTQVDVDHNGKPSVGDLAVAPGLYVNAAGKQIGSVFASCLQVNVAGTRFNCQDYNHFPGGDIITGDRFSPTEKAIHEAILGGTGVYAGATGSVDGEWLKSDFSKAKVVFTLDS